MKKMTWSAIKDSGIGDGGASTRKDEKEKDSDDFFDAGEGVVGDRLSLRAESESVQSGGGTEDDPVGLVTPCTALTMAGGTISRKFAPVDFLRTISSDSADLDDDTRNAARACATCFSTAGH